MLSHMITYPQVDARIPRCRAFLNGDSSFLFHLVMLGTAEPMQVKLRILLLLPTKKKKPASCSMLVP